MMGVTATVPLLDVAALPRSLAFWVEQLGFEISERWVDDGGELRWVHLQLGSAQLMLQQFKKPHDDGQPEPAPPTPAAPMASNPNLCLCFFCDDAIEVWRQLRGRGAEATRPQVLNGMWCTELTDPDGNALLFESRTDEPEGTDYSTPRL